MAARTKLPESPYHHGALREALLSAAEAELSEKGVEAFSLRGVAKRAGVSHAAPAHHFVDVRGLLTALAERGFRRFVETQKLAMSQAAPDPVSQLVASGVGYVRFAQANPALFRLVFSSDRPNHDNPALANAGEDAFALLVSQVTEVTGRDPLSSHDGLIDISAIWAIAHGIADLVTAGRMKWFTEMPPQESEALIARVIARSIP